LVAVLAFALPQNLILCLEAIPAFTWWAGVVRIDIPGALPFFTTLGFAMKKNARRKNQRELIRHPRDIRLASALRGCRNAVKKGFAIAQKNLAESKRAINEASQSLSKCLHSLDKGSARTPEVTNQLKEQLSKIVCDLDRQIQSAEKMLDEQRNKMDRFSITLFGRTMSGKSTLMEILTKGNGKSIGTGAQRTTRDVRNYFWNGLEITDVPGIAAFEGTEDEKIAFDAAAHGDLALFLITDDAPQPIEAEWLAKVRRLGKPVLGVCNVKRAVDEDDVDDLKLFLRNYKKTFNSRRLQELVDQFHTFADQHPQGKRVCFCLQSFEIAISCQSAPASKVSREVASCQPILRR